MSGIVQQINAYLQMAADGNSEISDELIEQFGESCKELITKHLRPEPRPAFTIRMSSLGRPLCQQQLEKAGSDKEPLQGGVKMKLIMGDMIEALMVALIQAAGGAIIEEQTEVTLSVGGEMIKGHLDVVLDDQKIYDIKSVSPYLFTSVYSAPGGFETLLENDDFGYVTQAYLYSEATGRPFGGWLAVNKATGEIALLAPPNNDAKIRADVLANADSNVFKLINNTPFTRQFKAEKETFRTKETGNWVLPFTCEWCIRKKACWGDEITMLDQVKSKAKNPKKKYYLGKVKY